MKNQKNTAMLAVLLFMGLVIGSGAAMAAYTANPRNPTTYWMGANGVWQTDATFEARSPTGLTKYAKRTVPLTVGTLGRLAYAAMGGPVGLALTAAMVGYAVWDGTSWTTEPEPYTDTGTYYKVNNGAETSWYYSRELACHGFHEEATAILMGGTTVAVEMEPVTSPQIMCRAHKILANGTKNGWQDYFYTSTTTPGTALEEPTGEPLTYEQIGTKIAESSTLTKQVATDAIDRGTWRGGTWPEMEQAAADIAASLDRIDSGTATQADIDAERAMYAEPAPAAETQAIPDDYAREPTLQAVKDEATAIKNNTQALVDTLGNDGSNLPPWEPPTLPADPVPDWDYTGQFTAFWDWAKGLFPFSFLLSPLTAFGGTAPPPIPDFSITVLGNSQTLSLQPVSVVFSWIRTANGILLLFGFYLIGLSIARRFI